MKTTVINLKGFTGTGVAIIDRTTIFGNPYKLYPLNDRTLSLRKFRTYFYKKIHNDPKFLAAVRKLKGKKLGCWCKPLLCHGDIIVEFLEKQKGGQNP